MTQKNNTSSSDDLWRWSAQDMAAGIRNRTISAREAVSSCLQRIDQINPTLNALTEIFHEKALVDADAADKAVAAGQALGPLHGVPISIKVNSDVAGSATTHGVTAFRDNIAPTDSPHVANFRKAGAVIVARSNAPAFSYRWFTNNDLHGRTLNPWDASRTPGGSSGGASSAVASGMMPIGHGNDIGGSIRYPAHACGLIGLRPTSARVPKWHADDDKPLSYQLMWVEGALTRTVADARLAFGAMCHFDPRDPFYAPVPLTGAPLHRPIRVALLREVGTAKPRASVNQALDTAAAWLTDAGYVVEEVSLPLFLEAYKLWYLLALEEFRQIMPLVDEVGDDGMKLAAKYYYGNAKEWWGDNPGLTDYMNGYARRGTLINQLQQFLQDFPLLLLPVSAEEIFTQDLDIQGLHEMRRVMDAQWSMMAIPLLGFPAISVPTGLTNGLPAGVQILGRKYREDTLLDAAEVIEARAGLATPIDPR